ncbi:MAG: MFS transporter [Novosphingobium sp.]
MATAAPVGEPDAPSSYWGELAQHIKPLSAASLGVGTSLPLFAYTNSVFAPHLIEEFGWSRAQFALISLTMLTTLLVLPVIGRLTDRIGVRRVALIGTLLIPLCFAAYAMQTGSFMAYALVFTVTLAVASLTSTLVYSRLIAQEFSRAQGLALTVMNCAPAIIAIPAIPLLNWCIEHYGWRAAYAGLGTFVFFIGLVAVWLTDPHKPDAGAEPSTPGLASSRAREDYGLILKSPVFWVIVIAMFLCLLQTQLHSSQMNLMIIDQGMTRQGAAMIASVYALGTIVGRVLCGIALDHWSTRIVTAVSMGIPAIGFAMLGSNFDTVTVVTAAMFLVGVSVGAESDLICFLIARYFKLSIYGTTLGLVHCVSFLASASGGVAVSFTLSRYDSFTPFLWVLAGAITVGSLLFLLLPREGRYEKIG